MNIQELNYDRRNKNKKPLETKIRSVIGTIKYEAMRMQVLVQYNHMVLCGKCRTKGKMMV